MKVQSLNSDMPQGEKTRPNAYVTVEASFVFPFIICMIMAIIRFSFYMYGKVSVMCDSDRLLLKEERVYRDTGKIDNTRFYGEARDTLTGYPLASCIVSRCYGDYGEMVLEYVFNADLVGSIVPDSLAGIMKAGPKVRKAKADDRIEKARYISVGKSIFTRVKGYSIGWR